MRKILSLVLCLMLAVACIPAMAEEAAPVKTGLSFVTNIALGRGGAGTQTNIALCAVTVDDNGVIDACAIDYIQAKVAFDAEGKLTTAKGTEFQSKIELDDAYAMRGASSISAEWDEQANAFAAYCVGKTIEELKAAEVTESNQIVDILSTCTLSANEFMAGVEDAVAKAAHLGAKKGDALKLVQTSNLNTAVDATAEADGQFQVYAHVGAFTLNGDVITSAYIDAVQANGTFTAKGEVTSDLTAPVPTKNEKKEAYGMKGISPIGKEWYEQAAGFCAFITTKTVAEAVQVAANPAETDVVSTCTIKTGDFQKLLEKVAK